MDYHFVPIGIVHACFKEKFGIPRQAGLVPSARARVVLLPPFDRGEALEGLDRFSHVWLVFVFHAHQGRAWRPKVRPPRLGGNRSVGVFATRSTYRPNPVGISTVKLETVVTQPRPEITVSGGDLLDGTPVLDIKPYLPYADCLPEACGGFAGQGPPPRCEVRFSAAAAGQCRRLEKEGREDLQHILIEMLSCDPRPAYRVGRDGPERRYGFRIFDLEVKWRPRNGGILVESVAPPE